MAQLKDLLRVKDSNGEYTDYHILEIESGELFTPDRYNLKLTPEWYKFELPPSWRKLNLALNDSEDICIHNGYCGVYELSDSKFILKNLYTAQDINNAISVRNIQPTPNAPTDRNKSPYQTYFKTIYRGVNINFSNFKGSIILGKLKRKETLPIVTLEKGMTGWKKLYSRVLRLTFHDKTNIELTDL